MCWVIVLLRMKSESAMAVVVRLLARISGFDEFLCVPSVMPPGVSSVIPKGRAAFKLETAKPQLQKQYFRVTVFTSICLQRWGFIVPNYLLPIVTPQSEHLIENTSLRAPVITQGRTWFIKILRLNTRMDRPSLLKPWPLPYPEKKVDRRKKWTGTLEKGFNVVMDEVQLFDLFYRKK